MGKPRPSLNALRAFEATARLASLSAAARELNVTHGAVSRHIGGLEAMFGVPLLERSGRSVQATPQGTRLAASLSQAFAMIETGVEQLRPGPLTLSCSATIMMNWLIPRIAGFHRRHPEIELRFDMAHDRVDFVRDAIGVAIRNSGIEPPKEVVIRPMIDEWIGPVCSPAYRDAHGLAGLADLARCDRLATKTRPGAWAQWLATQAPAPEQGREAVLYEHFYLMIQAAICDLGIAIVPRLLVQDHLASGKLVAPFGFVPGPNRMVLWIAPHLRHRADTRALVAWLSDALRQSEAPPAAAPA
ncbi:LysR substrate-binding domain-containing protein [Bosea sp. TWI1241]|uniref:LysR substrate-binding domain-containing protein n=1 Tax=Bosea sp. TWI1241 TaxID=3148904 RepID=UPI003209BC11